MDKITKDPLCAVALSLLFPGAGHVYADKAMRGLIWFLVILLFGALILIYVAHPATRVVPDVFVLLAIFFCIVFLSLFDAYRCVAQDQGFTPVRNALMSFKGIAMLMGIAALFLLQLVVMGLIGVQICFSFTVPPYAMEPSLYPQERVLVNRLTYRFVVPRRGDVVLYRHPKMPKKVLLHRVIAFAGESVELRDHKIFINGEKLTDEWAIKVRHYNSGKLAKRGMKPVVVPDGHYYVLGDNAARSEDSRAWGFLPKKNIIGKVYKIYYPFSRSGPVR